MVEITQKMLEGLFLGREVNITHTGGRGLSDVSGTCTAVLVVGTGAMVRLGKGSDWFELIPDQLNHNSIEGVIGGDTSGRRVVTVKNILIEMALAGHHVLSPNSEVRVVVDEKTHSIWGHSTPHADMDPTIPVVELLRPHGPLAQPEAEESFKTFAEKLVRGDGKQVFYTVLHEKWRQPAMLWDRNGPSLLEIQ